MAVKGVDISEFNGGVNFDQLKQAGAKFVIIRTGFGSDYPGQQDKNFGVYVTSCENGDIPYGVYHYGYATTKQGGINEAKHCLRILNGRKPLYGVWYDMEDNSTRNGDLAAAAQGFCETIEAAGLYVGVYASLNWWNNYLTSSVFDKWDKWVAQYNSECQYKKPYGIWQFTSSWTIGGKKFDGNWAYKDYPAIVKAMNGETEKEEEDMTEAKVKEIVETTLNEYFENLAKKPASNGWGVEAVNFARENKIMEGDPDGNFRPRSNVTREESAKIQKNFLECNALKDLIKSVVTSM